MDRVLLTPKKTVKIGVLFSLTGVTSIIEKEQYNMAMFTINNFLKTQNNRIDLQPIIKDIRSDPDRTAKYASELVDKGVKIFIGCYTSACRKALLPILERNDALLVYPTLYEGMEAHDNVFYTGEIPNQQIYFLLKYIISKFGPKIYLIGTDYIYPHFTNRQIRSYTSTLSGEIIGESYVSFGQNQFCEILKNILQLKPNCILSTMVGKNIRYFYQSYYEMGLDPTEIPIISPITSEVEIKKIGAKYFEGHFGCASYFQSINSSDNKKFIEKYKKYYGVNSVISSSMMNTHNGIKLLLDAIQNIKKLNKTEILNYLKGKVIETPSGLQEIDPNNMHLKRNIYIGQINSRGQFNIVWSSRDKINPYPFYNEKSVLQKSIPWKSIVNIWKESSGDILLVLDNNSNAVLVTSKTEKLLNIKNGDKVNIKDIYKDYNINTDEVIHHQTPVRVLLANLFKEELPFSENTKTDERLFTFHNITTKNKKYREVLKLAELASKNDANVLITGETGTGKEMLARAIHENSKRKSGPFIAVNAGAIPKELISSELFGYVNGAFTGTKKEGHIGKFELANGGTLFLDEIGEMPLELQTYLLRVLDQKKIIRLGDSKERKIDVRVISATNKNLQEEIAYNNSFRSDLYYRLNVFNLKIPALRERKEDIEYLANEIIESMFEQYQNGPAKITAESIHYLQTHTWYGNIRELENTITRAFFMAFNEKEININHIHLDTENMYDKNKLEEIKTNELEKTEKTIIQKEVRNSGSLTEASHKLGISRSTLYRKIKKYSIES